MKNSVISWRILHSHLHACFFFYLKLQTKLWFYWLCVQPAVPTDMWMEQQPAEAALRKGITGQRTWASRWWCWAHTASSCVGYSTAGLWALLSLSSACHRSLHRPDFYAKLHLGESCRVLNFSNCTAKPPDCHFMCPKWENTAKKAVVFREDTDTDLTGPDACADPPLWGPRWSGQCRVWACARIWEQCVMCRQSRGYGQQHQGLLWTASLAVQGSGPGCAWHLQEFAVPCRPLCSSHDSDPLGVTADKVCLGFIVML